VRRFFRLGQGVDEPSKHLVLSEPQGIGAVAAVVSLGVLLQRPWRRTPRLSLKPSLRQVIRILRRVDPALGTLAGTVSRVWGLLEKELLEARASTELPAARTGSLLVHLFALGRLKSGCFDLPKDSIPLVGKSSKAMPAAGHVWLWHLMAQMFSCWLGSSDLSAQHGQRVSLAMKLRLFDS